MRRLICIPIVHTEVDLGSQRPRVKTAYIARYGRAGWQARVQAMREFWRRLREQVLALPLEYGKVRLYQDGLPVCGRELEITHELAGRGSQNHQLLVELVRKGATLAGTEDPSLLVEERNRLLAEDLSHHQPATDRTPIYDELLERRDEHIASTIAATLRPGETGILFVGALHQVVEKLPVDIEVEYLGSEVEKWRGQRTQGPSR